MWVPAPKALEHNAIGVGIYSINKSLQCSVLLYKLHIVLLNHFRFVVDIDAHYSGCAK